MIISVAKLKQMREEEIKNRGG